MTSTTSAMDNDCEDLIATVVKLACDQSDLHRAVRREKSRIVQQGIELYGRADVHAGSIRCTPLFIAAERGTARICEQLLGAGANPNARCTELGLTPVHVAAFRGNVAILRMLVDRGGDVRLHDTCGRNASWWAISNPDATRRRETVGFIENLRRCDTLREAQEFETNAGANVRHAFGKTSDRSLAFGRTVRSHVDSNLKHFGFGSLANGSPCASFLSNVIADRPLHFSELLFDESTADYHRTSAFISNHFFAYEPYVVRGRLVTRKRLRSNDCTRFAAFGDALINELNVLRRVSHPALLVLFTHVVCANRESLWLVFERVSFGSLFELLHSRCRAPRHLFEPDDAQKAAMLIDVCDALIYLHSETVLHAALTSHCVFVTSQQTRSHTYAAKLGGFEFAIRGGPSSFDRPFAVETLERACRTPGCDLARWLAPELVLGGRIPLKNCTTSQQSRSATQFAYEQCVVDHRADIYSFAVIVCEMLSGKLPFAQLTTEVELCTAVQRGFPPFHIVSTDRKFKEDKGWATRLRLRHHFVANLAQDALASRPVSRAGYALSHLRHALEHVRDAGTESICPDVDCFLRRSPSQSAASTNSNAECDKESHDADAEDSPCASQRRTKTYIENEDEDASFHTATDSVAVSNEPMHRTSVCVSQTKNTYTSYSLTTVSPTYEERDRDTSIWDSNSNVHLLERDGGDYRSRARTSSSFPVTNFDVYDHQCDLDGVSDLNADWKSVGNESNRLTISFKVNNLNATSRPHSVEPPLSEPVYVEPAGIRDAKNNSVMRVESEDTYYSVDSCERARFVSTFSTHIREPIALIDASPSSKIFDRQSTPAHHRLGPLEYRELAAVPLAISNVTRSSMHSCDNDEKIDTQVHSSAHIQTKATEKVTQLRIKPASHRTAACDLNVGFSDRGAQMQDFVHSTTRDCSVSLRSRSSSADSPHLRREFPSSTNHAYQYAKRVGIPIPVAARRIPTPTLSTWTPQQSNDSSLKNDCAMANPNLGRPFRPSSSRNSAEDPSSFEFFNGLTSPYNSLKAQRGVSMPGSSQSGSHSSRFDGAQKSREIYQKVSSCENEDNLNHDFGRKRAIHEEDSAGTVSAMSSDQHSQTAGDSLGVKVSDYNELYDACTSEIDMITINSATSDGDLELWKSNQDSQ